jgi:hypothetical protein
MALLQNLEATLNILFQLFIIFPYSALTIRRQRQLLVVTPPDLKDTQIKGPTPALTPRRSPSKNPMISDRVYKLCTSPESVSSLLAKDSSLTPGEAWRKLYGSHAVEGKVIARDRRDIVTHEDLARTAECGNWGPTQPSELFLQASLLCALSIGLSLLLITPR